MPHPLHDDHPEITDRGERAEFGLPFAPNHFSPHRPVEPAAECSYCQRAIHKCVIIEVEGRPFCSEGCKDKDEESQHLGEILSGIRQGQEWHRAEYGYRYPSNDEEHEPEIPVPTK